MLLAIVYVPIPVRLCRLFARLRASREVARWPLLALIVLIFLTLLYRYGPCRRTAKWRWVSVGSLFATIMWLIASAGYSFYVELRALRPHLWLARRGDRALRGPISFYIASARDQRRARSTNHAGRPRRVAADRQAWRFSPTMRGRSGGQTAGKSRNGRPAASEAG
jgi:hypothetical protein